MDYKNKLISIEQALKLVKSNDVIVSGMVACEPKLFLSNLHKIDPSITNVTVTNCLPVVDAHFFTDPEYAERFKTDSWFYSGALRKATMHGAVSYIPNHLSKAGIQRLEAVKTNIYAGVATPPDKHGFVSLSLSNVYEKRALMAADLVILEINPNFPRTFGDLEVHISDIDYMVEVAYPVPELPDGEITEKDEIIGRHIAELIKDGDCLQLGIGGIPNAVANALIDKKDLGVHTEMLTTGFMKLFQKGAITNKHKKLHPGKMVCCFLYGTKELYEFADNNTGLLVLDGNYVNDPYVIGQNDNQISINSSIEVDITGQCCSESLGSRHFSGTGGQVDTATGAQLSKGGKSFIALYSTAMVRNRITGEREEVSKIVSQLKPGAAVTLSRNDVDYVVTEYGAVKLKGLNLFDRTERLISIAHPKFRKQLLQEALELGIYSPLRKSEHGDM